MKIIAISGIIARWEMSSESNVTPETLRKSLDEANGEDVRIDINSPGGEVAIGLEMFAMIKNYSGNTETRIVSMAASMGSIIALSGDKKTAEKTASFMIHNASGIMWGDFRDMAKYAERLKAISGHLSNIYTDRTGVKNSVIKDQMNEETWTYGQDLTDYGFEIVDSANDDGIESAKFQAHNRYDNYIAEMKARPEEHMKDIEKVAASIAGMNPKEKPEPIQESTTLKVDENINTSLTGKEILTVNDFEKFLSENPGAKAIYDKNIADAKAEGKKDAETAQAAVVAKVGPIMKSDSYDPAMKEQAAKALSGEMSLDAFTALVGMEDMRLERVKTETASTETEETDETNGDSDSKVANVNQLETVQDVKAAADLMQEVI